MHINKCEKSGLAIFNLVLVCFLVSLVLGAIVIFICIKIRARRENKTKFEKAKTDLARRRCTVGSGDTDAKNSIQQKEISFTRWKNVNHSAALPGQEVEIVSASSSSSLELKHTPYVSSV